MLNNDYLIKYINFTSSIQTVTVGPGVSPSQRLCIRAGGRGLYRQWGISPRPEDISFSCPCLIIHGAKKIATPRFLPN